MKVCGKCKVPKDEAEFHNNSASKDGLQNRCRPCVKFYDKLTAEVSNERHRLYHEKNKEAIHKRKKDYHNKYKSSINEKRRLKYAESPNSKRERNRKWAKQHPHLFNAYGARYRASKSTQTPNWSDPELIYAIYLEANRLSIDTGIKYSVDHEVPLNSPYVSGLHTPDNLKIIPLVENVAKGNRRWPDMPDYLTMIYDEATNTLVELVLTTNKERNV
jgi:hypothetical protein